MTSRDLVLGTAGHIDHGKTALVRALTGIDTDRLPAEKQRGITIDLGFAALDLGDRRLAMIDVPGHERFIRNMLAGATGLDLALLIVAADDSVMPQTREHLDILRILGLPAGVIALTKCDLAEQAWLDLVEADIRALVAGSFLAGAPIIRTSIVSGEGLDELKSALRQLAETAPVRLDPGLFRMAIDRSFTVAGHGTVVTGTVASGTVAVGDELEWWPAGRAVRVRGLQRHDVSVERVARGARAALNLAGARHTEIQRGHELAAPGYLRRAQVLSIALTASAAAPGMLRHRGRYRLHLGTSDVAASLVLFEGGVLAPGVSTLGQLLLREPVVAVHGEPFVLRSESPPMTLGGGRVLQPTARRIRRRDLAARSRLAARAAAEGEVRVGAVLDDQGLAPWTDLDLVREAGVTPAEATSLVASLFASEAIVELPIGPRRVLRLLAATAAALEDRVLRALGRLHAARPRQTAIRRSHLAAELPDLPGDALIGGLLDRLQARGEIVASALTVARRDHQPKLSQNERKLKADLAAAVRSGGMTPPDRDELARQAGPRAGVLTELLALLIDEGQLIEIGPGLFLDAEIEGGARRRARDLLESGKTLTVAQLRDLLGTTRKFAVPLAEHFDRVGLTRREGDLRLAGPLLVSATPP